MNVRYTLTIIAATLALASCGGGSSTSSKSAGPVASSSSSGAPSNTESTVKALLSIVIPSATAAEAPVGTTYQVSIKNLGTNVTQSAVSFGAQPIPQQPFEFKDLSMGTYEVTIAASYNTNPIATGKSTVVISTASQTVSVPLTFTKTSVFIDPVLGTQLPTQEALGGEYKTYTRISGCIKNAFGITSGDATLTIKDGKVTASHRIFPDIVLKFDADLLAGDKFITGSGTFQSSDFTSGTVAIDKLVQVEDGSIYLSATLNSGCETKIDISGFKTGPVKP